MKTRKLFWSIIRFGIIVSAAFTLLACTLYPSAQKIKTANKLSDHKIITPDTNQVLLVADSRFSFFTSRKVYALEKRDDTWRQALDPVDAVIGRNGFAPPGQKREGDGRTPSGLYRLGTAFGYAESAATKMPYRQLQSSDLWVDDPEDPDYNRWVRQNETQASSYEKMKRDDDLYKYGIVIEYNTDPVIKGHGSAIFFHVWAGSDSTTAGCVAVSEEDILKILDWLNPAANPVILINPDNI